MRKWATRIALVTAGLLAAGAIAEVGLRLVGIRYVVFEQWDPVRGKALRPGQEGEYAREGRAHVRINGAGYRDHERTVARPGGLHRVAILGDSYVEARQVELGQTFPALLEDELAACRPAGAAVEVLNFGVSGYGTGQELLTWRLDASRYRPDLVLLAFFAANDLADNSAALELRGEGVTGNLRPQFRLTEGALEITPPAASGPAGRRERWMLAAIHRFRLLELVNQVRRVVGNRRTVGAADRIDAGLSSFVYGPPEASTTAAPDAVRTAWDLTEAILLRLRDEVVESGAEFALISIPSPRQVHPDPEIRQPAAGDYAGRRLERLGDREGFRVIRLEPDFVEAASRGTFLHGFENTEPGIGHWNRDGHRLAAAVIGAGLCPAPLPPPAAPS